MPSTGRSGRTCRFEQLTELTPWTRDAIERMVTRGLLVRGLHYFQPFGKRTQLIFKWAAIKALIEARPSSPTSIGVVQIAVEKGPAEGGPGNGIDVEAATAALQRMLD